MKRPVLNIPHVSFVCPVLPRVVADVGQGVHAPFPSSVLNESTGHSSQFQAETFSVRPIGQSEKNRK